MTTTKTLLVFVLLAGTVRGELYQLITQPYPIFDGRLFKKVAVIDTEADTLTWIEWNSGLFPQLTRRIMEPELNDPWQAVTPGPNGEALPYDIPNDWYGIMEGWGFLSNLPMDELRRPSWTYFEDGSEVTTTLLKKVRPGLGCLQLVHEPDRSYDELQCGTEFENQFGRRGIESMSWWPWRWSEYDPWVQDRGQDIGAGTYNIVPVSPSWVIGDSNWDGRFDSADLVYVFQKAQYGVDYQYNTSMTKGDWNLDGWFDSGDLVYAFQAGTYQADVQMAVAVPEPRANAIAAIGIVMIIGLCYILRKKEMRK